MAERPYTLLSCAMSIDGYIGGGGQERLLLSSQADFDRVEAVRESCDAILVGATTIRKDNPRLLVRAQARRERRLARGLAATPIKVTMTRHADLDSGAHFFTSGDTEKLVYCATPSVRAAHDRLRRVATVLDGGQPVSAEHVAEDLYARGVRRLMVEGGATMHTQFLTADLADELQLVIAPFFVGDSSGRRFVDDGTYPWSPEQGATLAEVRPVGDHVLLRYALSKRCPL